MTSEITDEELLAYLDGEAESQLAAQIEGSKEHLSRAKELAQLQSQLQTKLYRKMCPDSTELGEFHLGLLSKKQARVIKQHVAECLHCSQELTQLQEFLGEESSNHIAGLAEQVKVLVAQLVSSATGAAGFEYTGQIPTLGIRGEKEETYVYEADGVQIVIDIQDDVEHLGHKTLLGLVTGITARNFVVDLIIGGDLVASSRVDELGNFMISGISPGKYQLNIQGPEVEIQILTFQVKST